MSENGIACPSCGTQTRVDETRTTSVGVRRRRRCPSCLERVTTYEVIVGSRMTDAICFVQRRHLEAVHQICGEALTKNETD